MLKENAIRRIITSTIALIIVTILYFFPSNDANPIKTTTSYLNLNKTPIYLLNNNNYVIRTTIPTSNQNIADKIKELISALTIGSDKNEYIPSNFQAIIPQNTKLISQSLENGLLKLNFSRDLLNVSKENEEKLIESLIYTLTDLKEVKEIMIFIENDKLEYLPQAKINLPNTLTREFGINKIYDITNLKDLTKTTIYYIGKEDNLTYYVPVTKIDNNPDNKIKIIIDELKSSPIYETNLISYLASSVELLNYEELENQISLSFNNAIFSDLNNNDILEEVKYSIALSIQDSLNIENIIFKVNDQVISTIKAS